MGLQDNSDVLTHLSGISSSISGGRHKAVSILSPAGCLNIPELLKVRLPVLDNEATGRL